MFSNNIILPAVIGGGATGAGCALDAITRGNRENICNYTFWFIRLF